MPSRHAVTAGKLVGIVREMLGDCYSANQAGCAMPRTSRRRQSTGAGLGGRPFSLQFHGNFSAFWQSATGALCPRLASTSVRSLPLGYRRYLALGSCPAECGWSPAGQCQSRSAVLPERPLAKPTKSMIWSAALPTRRIIGGRNDARDDAVAHADANSTAALCEFAFWRIIPSTLGCGCTAIQRPRPDGMGGSSGL